MTDCVCDYDPPEFYHREIRRARKEHKCCECGGRMLPGEQYEHVRGKWDGFVDTYDTCARCCDLWMWTKNNVPCLCWAHHNRIEDCWEAICEATLRARDETQGLRFGFLRRLVLRDKFNRERRAR
jgi:hypothetical protein